MSSRHWMSPFAGVLALLAVVGCAAPRLTVEHASHDIDARIRYLTWTEYVPIGVFGCGGDCLQCQRRLLSDLPLEEIGWLEVTCKEDGKRVDIVPTAYGREIFGGSSAVVLANAELDGATAAEDPREEGKDPLGEVVFQYHWVLTRAGVSLYRDLHCGTSTAWPELCAKLITPASETLRMYWTPRLGWLVARGRGRGGPGSGLIGN